MTNSILDSATAQLQSLYADLALAHERLGAANAATVRLEAEILKASDALLAAEQDAAR